MFDNHTTYAMLLFLYSMKEFLSSPTNLTCKYRLNYSWYSMRDSMLVLEQILYLEHGIDCDTFVDSLISEAIYHHDNFKNCSFFC